VGDRGLKEEIAKENILATIKEEKTVERDTFQPNNVDMEKDPIQPIIDIVRGSLMNYDYEIVRYGLITLPTFFSTVGYTNPLPKTRLLDVVFSFSLPQYLLNFHDEFLPFSILHTCLSMPTNARNQS